MTDRRSSAVDPWLLAKLACPYDAAPLTQTGDALTCSQLHAFEVVDGIPVLLREDAPRVHRGKPSFEAREENADELKRYPIPQIPIPEGNGRALLDIGCNQGRWTFAASKKGYRAVGVDPDLGRLLVAKGIALKLGLNPHFVAGEARRLPFLAESFDWVFSHGVIQHFSKDDARQTFWEIGRVLCNGGQASVQMANSRSVLGVYRSLRHRRPVGSDVRSWSPSELIALARQTIGTATLNVDGFFGLEPLTRVANSLYIRASRSESVGVRHQLLGLFRGHREKRTPFRQRKASA